MSLTDKPSADASAPGERRGLEVHGCPIYLYSHSLERSIFTATRSVDAQSHHLDIGARLKWGEQGPCMCRKVENWLKKVKGS